MFLFDTSVWIDYLKNVQTPYTKLLSLSLSKNRVLSCPTLFQEILQGMRDRKKYEEVYSLLFLATNRIENDPYEAAVGAANIYRTLLAKGITIRKPNDCLIAWYCLENDLELVHNDVDFDMIAQHFPLKIWSDKA